MARQPQPKMPAGFLITANLLAALFAFDDALLSHGFGRIMTGIAVAALLFSATYTALWIRRMRRIARQPPLAPWAKKMADAVQRMTDGTQH